MSAIKHTELFDFPAYESALKGIRQSTLDFGKTIEDVIKRVSKEQKTLIAELKQYQQILNGFNTSSSGAGAGLTGLNTNIGGTIRQMGELQAVSKGLASVVRLQSASVQELKAEYSGIRKQIEALKPGTTGYGEELGRLSTRMRQVTSQITQHNASLKATTSFIKSAENSYKSMQSQLGQLRTRLREMPNAFDAVTGKMNKNNKEAVALHKEIGKLDTALKQADKSMGVYYRNVGNYSSAFSGATGSIQRYAVQLFSITAAIAAVSKSLDITKRFQSLNAAIEAVSSSSGEFATNQQFLRDIAQKYGQDIFVLSNAYKGLAASTKETSLEGVQTKKIFESVVQAGTALKISNEQLEGSLLAIQQMLSKGTVQSEELRGQLGERLPGAFRVFADSMGVSTAKLGEMLKKGEVLSNEALPKFARELNRLYGDKAIDNAKLLANEQNRFANAWYDLMNSNVVANFFTTVYKGLARFISDLNFTINTNAWKTFFTDANKLTEDRIAKEAKASEKRVFLENFEEKTEEQRHNAIFDRAKRRDQLETEIQEHREKRKQARLAGLSEEADAENALFNKAKEQKGLQIKLLDEMQAIDLRIKENIKKDKERNAGGDDSTTAKALAKRKAAIAKEQELLKTAYETDIVDLELALAQKQISNEDYELKKFTLTQDFANAAKAVEEKLGKEANKNNFAEYIKLLKEKELEFIKSQKKMGKVFTAEVDQSQTQRGISTTTPEGGTKTVGFKTEFSKDIQDVLDAEIQKKDAKIQAAVDAENKAFEILQAGHNTTFAEEVRHLKKLRQIKIDGAKSTADEDYAIARLNEERKKAMQEQFVGLMIEVATAGLQMWADASNAKFEKRINQLETEKQRELDAVGSNAQAREKIEKSFNLRIAKEKRKQAQAEKRNALFQIGVNTAIGVSKDLAAWNMPFALPFIAMTIASGLIQAAVVAAKPIPEFKEGTKGRYNAPAGKVKVAEKNRRELIMDRIGNAKLINKESIINLQGGERIFNNEETERLAHQALAQEESNRQLQAGYLASKAADDIRSAKTTVVKVSGGVTEDGVFKAVRKALKTQPIHQTIIDEKGQRERIINENSIITYQKNRY